MVESLMALLAAETFVGAVLNTAGLLDLSEKILELIGLSEDIGADLNKLLSSPLNRGFRNLEFAKGSVNDSVHHIKEATQDFLEAIDLEKGERLVSAYLGLIFCFHIRGEIENAKITLRDFHDKDICLYSLSDELFSTLDPSVLRKSFQSYLMPHKNLKNLKLLSEIAAFDVKTFGPRGLFMSMTSRDVYRNEAYMSKYLELLKNLDLFKGSQFIELLQRQIKVSLLQNQALEQIKVYESYTPKMNSALSRYQNKIQVFS